MQKSPIITPDVLPQKSHFVSAFLWSLAVNMIFALGLIYLIVTTNCTIQTVASLIAIAVLQTIITTVTVPLIASAVHAVGNLGGFLFLRFTSPSVAPEFSS